MTTRTVVRVPASTSNLGAGFDCIGVAIDRWLTLTAYIDPNAEDPVTVRRGGTLRGLAVPPAHDRLVVAFSAACAAGDRAMPHGLVLEVTSDIPVGRGLGSSAAAAVAGAAAANALLKLDLVDGRLVDLCASIEGHPDNVVPAIHGGAVLAVAVQPDESGRASGLITAPIELHRDLALAIAVPDFEVETVYMRAALPSSIPHAVGARAAALGAALAIGLTTAHPLLLEAALDDVLHVPYRRELLAGYDAVTQAAKRAGAFGATLSGSGSSLCAITPAAAVYDAADAMVAAWRALGVNAEPIACETPAAGYSAVARRDQEETLGAAAGAAARNTND